MWVFFFPQKTEWACLCGFECAECVCVQASLSAHDQRLFSKKPAATPLGDLAVLVRNPEERGHQVEKISLLPA